MVEDERGCQGAVSKVVQINSSPSASFDVSTNYGMPPLIVDFSNTSSEATSYLWKFNDETNSTSTNVDAQFTYVGFRDYNPELIATNDFGCKDTTTLRINAVDPIIDLNLNSITFEEREGKVFFDLLISNEGNIDIIGFDVEINLDNGSRFFETFESTIRRGESKLYSLNINVAADSNTEFLCTSIRLLGDVEDMDDSDNSGCLNFREDVKILPAFPNPITGDRVRLDVILPARAPISLTLINSSGAEIFRENFNDVQAGLTSFNIEINDFGKGVYILKITYGGNVRMQKLIKI